MILIFHLPRGLLLGGGLLALLAAMAHFLALGEFAQASKVILPAFGIGILLWVRLGGGRAN